jgi:hypothetical protein
MNAVQRFERSNIAELPATLLSAVGISAARRREDFGA